MPSSLDPQVIRDNVRGEDGVISCEATCPETVKLTRWVCPFNREKSPRLLRGCFAALYGRPYATPDSTDSTSFDRLLLRRPRL